MRKILTGLFAFLSNLFLRFMCSLNRLSTTGQDIFDRCANQGNSIFAFWHNRLFYLVYYWVKSRPRRKVSILISMSRDGDYAVAVVRKLKQDFVRGSTSRGGQKAIRALAAKLAAGDNIAITPDGPRGPAFKVSEGIIRLAQLTGARIVPVSYDATRKKHLKSWDRFILVKPFGRVHVAFAEPIEIPKDIDSSSVEEYRKNLEKTFLELDQICAEELSLNKKGN